MYSKTKDATLKMYSTVKHNIISSIKAGKQPKEILNKTSHVAFISDVCFLISKTLFLTGIRKSRVPKSKDKFDLARGFQKGFITVCSVLQTIHVTLTYLYFFKLTVFNPAKQDGIAKTSMLMKFVSFQYIFIYWIFWLYKSLSIYHDRGIVLMLNNIEILRENGNSNS